EGAATALMRWGKLRNIFYANPKDRPGWENAPTKGLNNNPNDPFNPLWLEAYGDTHYLGEALEEPFREWMRLPESENRSFWEWLKTQPRYYDELERESKLQYFTAAEREAYRITVQGGLLYGHLPGNKEPYDTKSFGAALMNVEEGFAAFVVSATSPAMYAGEAELGKLHHSSFMAGAPVLSAGLIQVEQGRLVRITNQSGHYRPCAEHLYNALLFLHRNHLPLSGVRVGVLTAT